MERGLQVRELVAELQQSSLRSCAGGCAVPEHQWTQLLMRKGMTLVQSTLKMNRSYPRHSESVNLQDI